MPLPSAYTSTTSGHPTCDQMPVPPPLPDEPVLKQDGFTIKNGVITCNGHERVDGLRLGALFHPERLRTQRDQKKAVEEGKRLFCRPFFAAQLRYYGISFPKSATVAQLKSLLDKAVAAQQCTNVPASVVRVHHQLKVDFERELAAWQKAVENWDEQWKRRQDEEWAQLETPTDRALHDLDRFMEHYFLTDGQPDPVKKSEPLALYGLTDDQITGELYMRAALVPGLELSSGGHGVDRTLCLGWDRAAVCGLAGEFENMARDKQRQRVQAEWEKAMETHRQFAESQECQLPDPDGNLVDPSLVSVPQGMPLALTMARGSFVVQCKTITDLFPDHLNIASLAINIADSPANNGETLRAAINFGVFQGTAILSFSQAVMDWFVRYYDKTALQATQMNGGVPSSGSTGGKRKADAGADGERPGKQRKPDEQGPAGRILVEMRGREMIEGNICPDIQHGYLDFTDGVWSKFKGVFEIPGVGEDVEVEGFRVAKNAQVEPPPWNWFWPGGQQTTEPEAQ